jgi:hypothetical protein
VVPAARPDPEARSRSGGEPITLRVAAHIRNGHRWDIGVARGPPSPLRGTSAAGGVTPLMSPHHPASTPAAPRATRSTAAPAGATWRSSTHSTTPAAASRSGCPSDPLRISRCPVSPTRRAARRPRRSRRPVNNEPHQPPGAPPRLRRPGRAPRSQPSSSSEPPAPTSSAQARRRPCRTPDAKADRNRSPCQPRVQSRLVPTAPS